MIIVLVSNLIVFSSLSVARAYPDGDPRNYRNTSFIRAHFEINRCIRHLKADLGVIPSPDAHNTALIADIQSLEMNPGVAGHWIQRERPIEVNELLIEFLASL